MHVANIIEEGKIAGPHIRILYTLNFKREMLKQKINFSGKM